MDALVGNCPWITATENKPDDEAIIICLFIFPSLAYYLFLAILPFVYGCRQGGLLYPATLKHVENNAFTRVSDDLC